MKINLVNACAKSNALAAQPTAAAQVSNVADRRSRSVNPKSASITVVVGQAPRLRGRKALGYVSVKTVADVKLMVIDDFLHRNRGSVERQGN
jgi:hypothetical protein